MKLRHVGWRTERVSVLDVEVRRVDPHVEVSVTKEVSDRGGSGPGSRLGWARWEDGSGHWRGRNSREPHSCRGNSHPGHGPPSTGAGDGRVDGAGDERLDLTDDGGHQILAAQGGGAAHWPGGGEGGAAHWSRAGADGAGAGAAVAGAAADGGVDSARHQGLDLRDDRGDEIVLGERGGGGGRLLAR